jgi:methionyl-tRNA formyltransferase
MGTPPFAAVSLKTLVGAGHDVAGVFSRPDRPAGRGRRLKESAVKELAQTLGLPVFQPERPGAAIADLRTLAPEIVVVVAYGRILPPEILALPPAGCVNLHASLLPAYRGAAPIQWALLNGETRTGVTTMRMDSGLDTGDILLQRECPILPEDDLGALQAKLAGQGAELLLETLRRLETGLLAPQPQRAGATMAPRLKREDERLNWTEDAFRLACRIRALSPRPGAFTELRGETLKVWAAEPRTETVGAAPGEIIRPTEQGLLCAAGSGGLELKIVQPAGRGRMTGADFARGRRLRAGERFAL